MEARTKVHVGLDVHKDTISVGAAEAGRAAGRVLGKIAHDVNRLLKVLTKLGGPEDLHVVYEAGPTGWLATSAAGQGVRLRGDRTVADTAPPRRPGQDRWTRLCAAGRVLACRATAGGVGARAGR
jgi:hypothetical protein